MRVMREEIEVLKRTLEEQKLRAQRDALAAEVKRGAGGGRRREATARDPTSSPAVPTSGLATQTGTSHLTFSRPTNSDNIDAHFRMRSITSSKFKQQQQQQHGHPRQNRWDNSGPNPLGRGDKRGCVLDVIGRGTT